jgi:phage baseplate assembly protein W
VDGQFDLMAINTSTNVYGGGTFKANNTRIISKVKSTYGMAYPIVKAGKSGGYFSKSSGVELHANHIVQILKTSRGERLMLPDFGANLKNYLFNPNNNVLIENIKRDITVSLGRYAPEVEIQNIGINTIGEHQVNIRLALKIEEEEGITIEVPITI